MSKADDPNSYDSDKKGDMKDDMQVEKEEKVSYNVNAIIYITI